MKTNTRIHCLIILVFIACNNLSKNKQNHTLINKQNWDDMRLIEGHWILTNYYDSILKDKSISKYRLNPIAWHAIVIKIANDSLFYNGLIHSNGKMKLNHSFDSLAVIKDNAPFKLYYNKILDRIEGYSLQSKINNNFHLKTFKYRRISEANLVQIVDENNYSYTEKMFRQLFIDSILVGKYNSIDNKILQINSNGTLTGFKSFNKFYIHDYFGTYHPFHNHDVITFENIGDKSLMQKLTTNKEIYNWRFVKDTLVLTEMKTVDSESYCLGKKMFKFLKKT